MNIRDDDDLYVEISAARVLLKTLKNGMHDIPGHYDENGWFIPNDNTMTRSYFSNHFEEWHELVRAVFDKLDEAYTYLDEKLTPKEYKKAASPQADQSKGLTAQNTTGNG